MDKLWIEAEAADTISGTFQIDADPDASEDLFVQVPEGSGSDFVPVPGNEVTYQVVLDQAASYLLWGRTRAISGQSNSFFVQIDNGPTYVWDLVLGPDWIWDEVNDRGGADPVFFSLAAGPHTIRIKLREDGSQIDKLLLTRDLAFVPSGAASPRASLR